VTDLPADLKPLILCGHVIDVLRSLPEKSVQCVVTSPPYWGLRAYGTEPQVWGGDAECQHRWLDPIPGDAKGGSGTPTDKNNRGEDYARGSERGAFCACGAWRGEFGLEPTPELYVAHTVEICREIRRVLRDDGVMWWNLGDSYFATGGGQKDVGKAAYSPGDRPRKHATLKPKDLVGIPWRVAFALQDDGWWLRSDVVWSKNNPMPESITDRPSRAHEYIFLLTKSERYFYDQDAVRTALAQSTVREVAQGYNGTATKLYEGTGAQDPSETKSRIIANMQRKQDALGKNTYTGFNDRYVPPESGANLRTVWQVPTQPYKEAHFATFPEEIPRRCILLGTSEKGCCAKCGAPYERDVDVKRPEGYMESYEDVDDSYLDNSGRRGGWEPRTLSSIYGTSTATKRETKGWSPTCSCEASEPTPCIVLDPFAGSGTTMTVARGLGRRSIGVELKDEYVKMARRRCSADVPDLMSFSA
jgi:DNA modification methylase